MNPLHPFLPFPFAILPLHHLLQPSHPALFCWHRHFQSFSLAPLPLQHGSRPCPLALWRPQHHLCLEIRPRRRSERPRYHSQTRKNHRRIHWAVRAQVWLMLHDFLDNWIQCPPKLIPEKPHAVGENRATERCLHHPSGSFFCGNCQPAACLVAPTTPFQFLCPLQNWTRCLLPLALQMQRGVQESCATGLCSHHSSVWLSAHHARAPAALALQCLAEHGDVRFWMASAEQGDGQVPDDLQTDARQRSMVPSKASDPFCPLQSPGCPFSAWAQRIVE
mmetsp:Transcript_114536/g.198017  ORF Transcript_114536/g.198017 Transcript_114536/m.198017 type:complete len:277 (+) Transcript_114536:214-1044(+)